MIITFVDTDKVQEFFQDHREDLEEVEVEVAECQDSSGKVKSKIYFTIDKTNSACNQFEMIIEPGGITRTFSSIPALAEAFQEWIETDEHGFVIDWSELQDGSDDEESDEQFIASVISERENELYFATQEYLDVITGGSFDDMDCASIVDDILELLAAGYGYSVYRPSILENGELAEFPYDSIAFPA